MTQVKTVLLTELKSALSTKLNVKLRPVLCYAVSLLFLFFMNARSLWSWATRPGCSSRVIAFFFPVSFKYEYACFNVFNCPLATTNSSSVFWIPDKDNLGLPSYLMRDLVADNLLFSTRLQGQKICLIFTSY